MTYQASPALSEPAVEPAPLAAVRAVGLRKVYGTGPGRVVALDQVDVLIPAGRFTAVMGPSGSGKSTLLHCLAGLDRPSQGSVYLGDTALETLSDTALTEVRRREIGFVFQTFNLVPTLSAAENITLPLAIAGRKPDPALLRSLVATLGLADRLRHRPAELSGGQQQRVALARALITRPRVIFADEPTGALDSRTGDELLRLMRYTVDEHGQTVVMVTHDPRAAAIADDVLFLADGQLRDRLSAPTVEQVLRKLTALDERR
ncbi:ABC transporter ATP-binding protein [Micromonospora sp. HM5-17]|jgi:putative ABC transport system ATP-binding protein|uniref:ABC transporter ATP-binding protein n=1 Tax=Micromonospora sp. HM5-17 TaxID=2487710 RepID=UPI000F47206F|nr:ABC transporter ATP-binding protein [Micromonospora sp. HM5-17]ROT33581.1 ABC transporter ATP-binding protein [Micromonospora sp. HM5-17]